MPERLWIRQGGYRVFLATPHKPVTPGAVEYMRVLSRQEVEKLANDFDGVDVQQYINSLRRTIEGQRKHIASLTAHHGPQCICAACEDKRARMTL